MQVFLPYYQKKGMDKVWTSEKKVEKIQKIDDFVQKSVYLYCLYLIVALLQRLRGRIPARCNKAFDSTDFCVKKPPQSGEIGAAFVYFILFMR
jgi:hypothetical protein